MPAGLCVEESAAEPVTVLEGASGAPSALPMDGGAIAVQGMAGSQAPAQATVKSSDVKEERLRQRVLRDLRNPARRQEIKAAGRARLVANRARRGAVSEETGPSGQRGTLSQDTPGRARKMKTLPLVAPPHADCGVNRQRDIERLTAARQKADNALERDRVGLNLAAAHVGSGEIDAARTIYEDLAQHAAHDGIRQTARENLQRIGAKTAANNAGVSAN